MTPRLSAFLGFILISHSSALYTTTAQCTTSRTYTVVVGDSCAGIAHNNNVPKGSLVAINDCSNLYAGQVICLPDPCQLRTISFEDTCLDITEGAHISLSQLLSWNPFINSGCTNLIAGDQVCVTQPALPTTTSAPAVITATKRQNGYATEIVAPPGRTPRGTTLRCGRFYQVRNGDYCDLISNNFSIDLELFEAINPAINDDCTNLIPGLYYCVLPTADWNGTSTTTVPSTYITAPAPTTSGSTGHCYQWYVVQSGDTCIQIQSLYGVTTAQLVLWNPSLRQDCSNLRLGHAYCVHGDPSGISTMTMILAPREGVWAEPTPEVSPPAIEGM